METGLQWGAAIAALAAAVLWIVSASVKVRATDVPDAEGMVPATIETDGTDFLETARLQTLWNKRAAWAAAIAAGLQAAAFAFAALSAK